MLEKNYFKYTFSFYEEFENKVVFQGEKIQQ